MNSGFLYMLRLTSGRRVFHKIGITRNPEQRFNRLRYEFGNGSTDIFNLTQRDVARFIKSNVSEYEF